MMCVVNKADSRFVLLSSFHAERLIKMMYSLLGCYVVEDLWWNEWEKEGWREWERENVGLKESVRMSNCEKTIFIFIFFAKVPKKMDFWDGERYICHDRTAQTHHHTQRDAHRPPSLVRARLSARHGVGSSLLLLFLAVVFVSSLHPVDGSLPFLSLALPLHPSLLLAQWVWKVCVCVHVSASSFCFHSRQKMVSKVFPPADRSVYRFRLCVSV